MNVEAGGSNLFSAFGSLIRTESSTVVPLNLYGSC